MSDHARLEPQRPKKCWRCNGWGYVANPNWTNSNPALSHRMACPACGGVGQ